MTHEQKLEAIRQWCIAANPSLNVSDPLIHEAETAALKFINKVDTGRARSRQTYEDMKHLLLTVQQRNFMRPVHLADVLEAMQSSSVVLWYITDGGVFGSEDGGLSNAVWNLRDDDLTHQSQECIDFLYQLTREPLAE
jgi:hypothetical protein